MNNYNYHNYQNFKQQICAFLGVKKHSSGNKHLTCPPQQDDVPKSMKHSVCQESDSRSAAQDNTMSTQACPSPYPVQNTSFKSEALCNTLSKGEALLTPILPPLKAF
jgi:hypothetical protein